MGEYQEYSLRGRVFQTIRDNILNGVYQDNEELRENTIAQELGVSITPVREALRQLELEGLFCVGGIDHSSQSQTHTFLPGSALHSHNGTAIIIIKTPGLVKCFLY